MSKRTTVILEEEVYEALVQRSLDEYSTTKAISKVMNEILKKSLFNRNRLRMLIHSDKISSTTAAEFEEFRRGLSGRKLT